MSKLYERLSALCQEKGITGGKMCADIAYSKSLMTDLKSGKKKSVSAEVAAKLANYFDVSVDYLLGKTDQRRPLINNDPELTELLETLKNRSEMRMLFKVSKTATKEEVEQAVKIIEALRKDKP